MATHRPLPAQAGYVVPALPAAAYKPETPRPYNPFSYHARMVAFVAYLWLSAVTDVSIQFAARDSGIVDGRAGSAVWHHSGNGHRRRAADFRARAAALDVPAGTKERAFRNLSRPLSRWGWGKSGPRWECARRGSGRIILAGLLGYTTTLPLLIISSAISYGLFSRFHTPPHPVLLEVTAMHTPFDRLLLLLETAVLVPIIEETMFRGMLYPALRERWGRVGRDHAVVRHFRAAASHSARRLSAAVDIWARVSRIPMKSAVRCCREYSCTR